MNFSIRQASKEEKYIAFELLKAAALRLQSAKIDQWQYWIDPPEYKVKWLEKGFELGEYFFASMNDQIVAMYRLSHEDLEYWGVQNDNAKYLHSLVINPKYAGQSLGSKILNEVENQLQLESIPLLRLDCHSGNKRLCAYYENRGFIRKGEVTMPHSKNNLYEKKLL